MKMEKAILAKARAYLDAGVAERHDLKKTLDSYTGDPVELANSLRPQPPAKAETGWMRKRPFRLPRLAAKYPDEMFTLYVPANYTPSKAYGLVFFLHGGGRGQPRFSGDKVFEGYGINDLLEESGRIVCYPCSPPNAQSFAAWNQACVDEYLADVIEELEHFYNIDPHDMIMGGNSMGGQGVFHLAQRFPDRFHSFLVSAGSWDFGYWQALTGTNIWLSNGVNDAIMFKRRHGTDVEFTRLAKLRLDQANVPCVYREHVGHHSINRRVIREWLAAAEQSRRDPFYPLVVAVTPRGCTQWIDWRRNKTPPAAAQNYIDFHDIPPAPHNRWVSIDKSGDETLIYDMLTMNNVRDDCEADWNAFELRLGRKHIPGAAVEVCRCTKNVMEIQPRNIKQITLWLHPDLIDLQSLRVMVMGREYFSGAVKPSLSTTLDSYLRRRDWGMLYPAALTLEADEKWGYRDQLKLEGRV